MLEVCCERSCSQKECGVKPPKAENPFRVSKGASSSLHGAAEMGSRGTGRSINALEGRNEGKTAEATVTEKRARAS